MLFLPRTVSSSFRRGRSEIASRRHLEIINSVIDEALSKAGVSFKDLDGLAVFTVPAWALLLVGVSVAKALSSLWNCLWPLLIT